MRTIDWDKPLSEEDIAWASQRDMHDKIQANRDRFSKKAGAVDADDDSKIVDAVGTEAGEDDEPADDYDSWKVAELREEAGKRDPVVDVEGLKKDEIIAALRDWDAANPD